MTITKLTLSRPLEVDGKQIAELDFRLPTEADRNAIQTALKGRNRLAAAIRVLAILTGLPVTALGGLSVHDVNAAFSTVKQLLFAGISANRTARA